jgi:hypothetical protein
LVLNAKNGRTLAKSSNATHWRTTDEGRSDKYISVSVPVDATKKETQVVVGGRERSIYPGYYNPAPISGLALHRSTLGDCWGPDCSDSSTGTYPILFDYRANIGVCDARQICHRKQSVTLPFQGEGVNGRSTPSVLWMKCSCCHHYWRWCLLVVNRLWAPIS